MSFVDPDKTHLDMAVRVHGLHELVWDIVNATGKAPPDARMVNLSNIMMATNAAEGTLRMLARATAGPPAPSLAEVFGLADPSYAEFMVTDMIRATRNHLLVEGQFQIETFFRNVLRGMGKADPTGFWKLSRAMLEAAALPDATTKHAILNVSAKIRNSMHKNGVHDGDDSTVVIDGMDFEFRRGERVRCGHWVHVCAALGASMRIIDEVIRSPGVSVISLIADPYSVLAAKVP